MGELEPLKNTLVMDFLDSHKARINGLVDGYSSPLNIIFPQIFIENIDAFRRVFLHYGMERNVFFSSKANKSAALLEAVIYADIGLEVGSYYELQVALSKGIGGSMIIASGPGKTEKYLILCLRSGAMISIDSGAELTKLIELCKKTQIKAPIIFRINNSGKSKFGIENPTDKQFLDLIKKNKSFVDVIGVSGHIDGSYDLESRVKMIKSAAEICNELKRSGWKNCKIIDIGGGFTVQYTTEAEWRNFNSVKQDFWGNKHFSNFYPYYTSTSGPTGLKYILESKEDGKRIHEVLKLQNYELAIEPGRALLDQVGITVMKIIEKKRIGKNWLLIVDANINHLSEQWFNTDFLISPELIPNSKLREVGKFDCYIGGNLCLEQDMLSWHKVSFNEIPNAGDLLVFYNTAGYQMDSNETEFMRIPIAKKICAIKTDGKWKIYDDNSFSQVNLLEGDTK